MQSFADSFPSICKLHNIGTLSSGRKILIIQISDNVGVRENEPSFLYTSSMHGNELTGYVLMLRLIDELLNGYGINTKYTNLINEVDIWINPMANPDGAYYGGNHTIQNAIRYNGNFVDLNRNYPDIINGNHPDGVNNSKQYIGGDFKEDDDNIVKNIEAKTFFINTDIKLKKIEIDDSYPEYIEKNKKFLLDWISN